jgi:reverse gyrase
MDYKTFLQKKDKNIIKSGFDINENELNKKLFDFQKYIVQRALKVGRYAIFADTGLGKTPMQLEWAVDVMSYTKKCVLILAPLAVSNQTIQEGKKFNITVHRLHSIVNN